MITAIILSIAVGALLWLDRVYIFQFMVSRPIILSPILGVILGEVEIGLIVGASLELLWLNAPPVGAYQPNDESFCAVVAVPAAVIASSFMNDASASGLALIACLPMAFVGRVLDTRLRSMNQNLLLEDAGDIERAAGYALGKSLIRSYVAAYAVMGFSTGIICAAIHLVGPAFPSPALTAFSFMPTVSVLIGLAGLITKELPRPSQAGLFVLGMVIVLMFSWVV